MSHDQLRKAIEDAWEKSHAATIADESAQAVKETLDLMEAGEVRAASKGADGQWVVHEWVKKAILLHFRLAQPRRMEVGEFQFYDKVDLQGGWARKAVRVAPPAVARRGAYLAPGVVLMPCYVNIGAYVGRATMVDTWATIGSCAQIGQRCHISGGTGIGGVLEPLQARPVIIEDGCFIGARCEVAEGALVGEGAVLAMGCFLGASTKIYDATTKETLQGAVPPRAVVVPGSLPSADGSHHAYALIIKKYRDARTDARVALNEALR